MKDRWISTNIILLLLTMLLALGLRTFRLDAQSLWYDEGFSVYLANMNLDEITTRTAADIQPPLYYYLLHGWINILGDDEWAVRTLSLLLGAFTIPLVYAVAWLLFRNRVAGLLAALFLAVSPLHIWYGQETRMYTLLTFLCVLSSYLLLLITHRLRASRTETRTTVAGVSVDWALLALWAGYTLTNIAAIYTHYFAFFVMASHAVYLLLVWGSAILESHSETAGTGLNWRSPETGLLLGGLVSGVLTMLVYVPWLPHLLARYGTDVSYWPGELKISEVFIDIIVFFVGGESISEATGVLLAWAFGLVLLLSLLALYFRSPRNVGNESDHSPFPVAFLLLYLLLPPVLILLLSYNTPKFNARYVLVSHPAFVLLLSGGLAALWKRGSSSLGNVIRGAVAGLAVLFVLSVSAYADYQAYTNPAFARADFRNVVRYLNKHKTPDETVILLSGHMFPVFDYYGLGMERHLLPDSPTLDTTRVVDYDIASTLREWLAGRDGVWVVLWQDEVVDPAGFLTTVLGEVGTEEPVNRTFPKVGLRYFRLPEDAEYTFEPKIAHPADFNFGNELHLLGYTQTSGQQVTLFWEALQPLDQDFRVSVVLRDTLGQSWGQWDGRPTAYYYPTDRWEVGQVVFGRYDLDLLSGSPPGDYGLEVGIYTEDDPVGLDVLDQAGAPQGKRAMLGAVRLAVPAVTADELGASVTDGVDLGGGLRLLDWELGRVEAQPGDRMLLTAVWLAESLPSGDYQVRLLVEDATGQIWDAGSFPPTNEWHPTSTWLPGQAWRGQMTFRLPILAQPGEARLSIQLADSAGHALGDVTRVGSLEVLATDRSFSPPRPQALREANFDNQISLLGGDLAPEVVAPGGLIQATLYWQAWAEMDVPYTVFVHLLGNDGQVVAGHDGEPVNGTRPMTSWVPGEYVTDPHSIELPADLAPGQYIIEVGAYDAGVPSMPRLPILGSEGQIETDRVIFGPVVVK